MTDIFAWLDGAPLWALMIVIAAIYTLAMLVITWARSL